MGNRLRRYTEDATKTAEYLRQTLPLMSKQKAAYNPVTYAVWYEYIAGINPGLTAAIQELLGKGASLDDEATENLYRRYIADIDESEAQRINEAFQAILSRMAQSAAHTGNQASRFNHSLAILNTQLESQPVQDENLSAKVQQLLGDSQTMQHAVSALETRLSESRQEIELLKQEVQRARKEAMCDALTGLTNRKGLDAAIQSCIDEAESKDTHPCILIADIDHFKKINDTYGHLFGDKVIRAVAHIIKQNVKGKDTAARYGGEEFVVLLPDTPMEGARALAETIRNAVQNSRIKHAETQETVSKITISVGVASYRTGESAHDFVQRADKALYNAKQTGRNRTAFF